MTARTATTRACAEHGCGHRAQAHVISPSGEWCSVDGCGCDGFMLAVGQFGATPGRPAVIDALITDALVLLARASRDEALDAITETALVLALVPAWQHRDGLLLAWTDLVQARKVADQVHDGIVSWQEWAPDLTGPGAERQQVAASMAEDESHLCLLRLLAGPDGGAL
jgi:hypothetical protein